MTATWFHGRNAMKIILLVGGMMGLVTALAIDDTVITESTKISLGYLLTFMGFISGILWGAVAWIKRTIITQNKIAADTLARQIESVRNDLGDRIDRRVSSADMTRILYELKIRNKDLNVPMLHEIRGDPHIGRRASDSSAADETSFL